MQKQARKKIQLKFPEKQEEKKSKRKIELRFRKPQGKKLKDEEESDELEQIISRETPNTIRTNIRASPALEISNENLENQLANVPAQQQATANAANPAQTTQYTITDKYANTGQAGNYSGENNYESRIGSSLEINPPSLQLGTPQSQFIKQPTMFKSSSPFDTPDYPKPEEKKYDSPMGRDLSKQRRRW